MKEAADKNECMAAGHTPGIIVTDMNKKGHEKSSRAEHAQTCTYKIYIIDTHRERERERERERDRERARKKKHIKKGGRKGGIQAGGRKE